MTILDHASEILYQRKEEKERQYGPFKGSIEHAALAASVIAGHRITSKEVYAVLIGVKLSRQGHSHKRDNILDAIVYMAQMNDENENNAIHDQTEKIQTPVKRSRPKIGVDNRRKTGNTKKK